MLDTELLESGYTHGGRFHADDVFSTALLHMLNPKIKVHRVMDVPKNTKGIIYDIGRGEFDHHQEDALVRENGVPYAAFGLLWRKFGPVFFVSKCTEEQISEAVQRFDESFVQPLIWTTIPAAAICWPVLSGRLILIGMKTATATGIFGKQSNLHRRCWSEN